MKEQRKIDASDHQNHESVQGYLAQHERPVIGEYVVEHVALKLREMQARVQPAAGPSANPTGQDISQNPGPGGAVNPPPARKFPFASA